MKAWITYMSGAVGILWSLLCPTTQAGATELRVDDLPKPIPQAMDKVKEVGNEVGRGISKAAGTTADAVQKTVKGDTSEKRISQRPAH